MASLDHALWFHREVRIDEWLLYSVDSPNASGARGFARGQFFNAGRRSAWRQQRRKVLLRVVRRAGRRSAVIRKTSK